MAQLVLGGGCFWCVEAAMKDLRGVQGAVSGYAGGEGANPSYEAVCSGRTGHAEVIRIDYDDQQITLRDLLDVFFTVHDPTTLNRQGNDVGSQYRSVVYYDSDSEKEAIHAAVERAQELYDDPIVTEISPLPTFYEAESYHQNYFENNPRQPYCAFVVAPKVAKARKQWAHLMESS